MTVPLDYIRMNWAVLEHAQERLDSDHRFLRWQRVLRRWAGPAQSVNQCDGCCAGIPLQGGLHNMGRPGGYRDLMTCERSKYESA